MDALITALFGKTENIALLLSFTANLGLSWFVVFLMREGRSERNAEQAARAASMEKFSGSLEKLVEAVTQLRIMAGRQ